ncbi:MAG: hypothetical protein ABI333_02830 [bacterium]
MKRSYLFVSICFVAMLGLMGCSVTESTNVKTSGIYAIFTVYHRADGTVSVRGTLRVGGSTGTIVDLASGEHLEVNGQVMSEFVDPITDYHWSRAIIDPDPAGVYDIDFVRLDELVTTTVLTPEPPTIVSLDPGDVVFSEDTLTITWDDTDPGQDVDIYIEGDCIENHADFNVPDTGAYTSGDIYDIEPMSPTDCTLTVTVERFAHDGGVNGAYQGGVSSSSWAEEAFIDFETTL